MRTAKHALESAPTATREVVTPGARAIRALTQNATEITARSALEASGLGHLRIMALSMLALIQLGFLATWLFDAALSIKLLARFSLGGLLAVFVWAWRHIEKHALLTKSQIRLAAVPTCVCVVCANYAFGLASSFSAAVAIGLGTFAASTSRVDARLAYATIASGYAIGTVFAQLGIGPSPLFPIELASPFQHLAAGTMVEVIYLAAYATGRMTRREHKHVVEHFEQAVRAASKRDALLAEAQDALKHAAGIGAPGRFTDQVLDGFRLGNVIGRGGMGEVYAAQREHDGERAAMKLMRLDALGERSALSRFARETEIAASLKSPHVVRVLGVSGADSVFPYIAMEHLQGTDLAAYLRDHRQLALSEVTVLVEQVAQGLAVAHAHKIVHRDLKPNNLFRAREEGRIVWKVLDFGVSKLLEGAEATLTMAELVGTPQYMAPEQAQGSRELDQRADVYALAAIAYRALCGEPPFTGQLPAILTRISEAMPAAPSSRAPVPKDIDLVLALGLAKSPSDRIESAPQLARAFAAAAREQLPDALRARALNLLRTLPYAA